MGAYAIGVAKRPLLARRVRRLGDLRARTAGPAAGVGNDVLELDAIVLLPYLAEPVSDVAAQNERVTGRLAFLVLVGNEGGERDGGKFYLLEGPLIKLRDGDLDSVI